MAPFISGCSGPEEDGARTCDEQDARRDSGRREGGRHSFPSTGIARHHRRLPLPMKSPLLAVLATAALAQGEPLSSTVAIVVPEHAAPRVTFGVSRLAAALEETGRTTAIVPAAELSHYFHQVIVGPFRDPALRSHLPADAAAPGAEGFSLATDPTGALVVAGADDSGMLYGCLELARRTRTAHGLPDRVSDTEAPAFHLRGPTLVLQKSAPPPGDGERPHTPEFLPFFYEKAFWAGYLDFLAENRLNALYLGSGRSLAALVKLTGDPDAAMARYLVTEADKRGIRLEPMDGTGEFFQPSGARPPAETLALEVLLRANLAPFRYGDQRLIKASVQAMRARLGAGHLQFEPLSTSDWPHTPDKTSDPLLEYQRDWIWFEAWARYAWNPDVPAAADHAYWVGRLAKLYGGEAAENILAAYNDAGECAPQIIRRFGSTEGHPQMLSLGMTLDQLVGRDSAPALPEAGVSQLPPGEGFQEYADRDWNKLPHSGETPPRVMRAILHYSESAVREIDTAAAQVTDNTEEFGRLLNDIHCIRELSLTYAAKAQAALLVLRYRHSRDIGDMESASRLLAISLDHYRALARLTAESYQFAHSRPADPQSISLKGGFDGKPAPSHGTELVPIYEKELADFQAQVAALRRASP